MSGSGFRRILIKLSGEALGGESAGGIVPDALDRTAADVVACAAAGTQLALVLGGGNLFRGAGLAARGMDRVRADQMGMLATVMNGLAMQDALTRLGAPARLMSAFQLPQICDEFDRSRALDLLDRGVILIFAGGTGNPFFTTDSAASLRAIEIGADLLIKATKVDGVYSADPVTHPDARFYPRLSYDRALEERLAVMDATALILCRDHALRLRVMNMRESDALLRAAAGEDVGTLVALSTDGET